MGASVQPTQPDPKDVARIQANVAKMRAAGAPESDVLAYLQHEDEQASQAPAAPAYDTSINTKNLIRSMLQGGMYGFGDEAGVVDPKAYAAFKSAHPIANAIENMIGGAIAPAAAAFALPELAGLGGAVALGAGGGALAGAGEGHGGPLDPSRLRGEAIGAPVGAAGALAGYGASKVLGGLGGAIMNRIAPARAGTREVGQAAKDIIDNPAALAARMKEVNDIVPGGSSPATAAIAPTINRSRFTELSRGVGASPKAGAAAESYVTQQRAALQAGRDALGDQMQRLGGDVTVTPKVRQALFKVRGVLGGKTPEVPAADLTDPNPLGLEKSTPFQLDEPKATMSIGELRDALSRLRFLSRGAVKKGLEANGVNTHEIAVARAELQDLLYDPKIGHPEFASLDRQYAILSNEQRHATQLSKVVEASRGRFPANRAHGLSSTSPGGSLTSKLGAAKAVLSQLVSGPARPAVADATARMVLKPGASVADLLAAAPKPSRLSPAIRAGLLMSAPPAGLNLFNLLGTDEQQP